MAQRLHQQWDFLWHPANTRLSCVPTVLSCVMTTQPHSGLDLQPLQRLAQFAMHQDLRIGRAGKNPHATLSEPPCVEKKPHRCQHWGWGTGEAGGGRESNARDSRAACPAREQAALPAGKSE